MLKSASNETILAYEIPNIFDEENVIIMVGQGKAPVLTLSGKFWKEQDFSYSLSKVEFDYNVPQDFLTNPARFFNQRLLNLNQCFGPITDYIFFAR